MTTLDLDLNIAQARLLGSARADMLAAQAAYELAERGFVACFAMACAGAGQSNSEFVALEGATLRILPGNLPAPRAAEAPAAEAPV